MSKIELRAGPSIVRRNDFQEAAIRHVLQNNVSFIWGPPGTGKTNTLGLSVAALLEADLSVLVLAHSNAAVDAAFSSIGEKVESHPSYKEGKVLRFGVPTPQVLDQYELTKPRTVAKRQSFVLVKQIENLEQQKRDVTRKVRTEGLSEQQRVQLKNQLHNLKRQLKPLQEKLRKSESELVETAKIVGCTLSKMTIAEEINQRTFDVVIIDEASMAYVPHCAFAATLADRNVSIFGDFRQLGPISQANTSLTQRWLHRDIFEEASITQKVNRKQQDSRLVMLEVQYRMHPQISEIPNCLVYGGKLKDGDNVAQQVAHTVEAQPNPGQALVFYDLSKLSAYCYKETQSHSRFNLISALIAVHVAHQQIESTDQTIGIITPYSAQARLIHRLLQDSKISTEQVKAATVHRFQGSEQDLIVFDAVEGPPQANISKLLEGGEKSTAMRLANVAVSRAKGKLIGLFNYDYLRKQQDSFSALWKFVDLWARRSDPNKLAWPADAQGACVGSPGIDYYPNHRAASQPLLQSMQGVKEEVAIHWPLPSLELGKDLELCFEELADSSTRFAISGAGAKQLASSLYNTDVVHHKSPNSLGFLGFDRKQLWVFINPKDPQTPVISIRLKQSVKLLYTFLNLIPQQDAGSIEQDVEMGKFPLGKCSQCNNPLWINLDGPYGAFVGCARYKSHDTRKVTTKDATRFARLMKRSCNKCGGQLQGVTNPANGQVFLACKERDCDGKLSLDKLL